MRFAGILPTCRLENQIYLKSLATVEGLQVGADLQKPRQAASAVVGGVEIYVPLAGLIDIGVERMRLEKEIARIERQLSDLSQKLRNQDFLRKAPPEVVDREKKKEDFEANLRKLQVNLASLEG